MYFKHVIALARVYKYAPRDINWVPRVLLQIVVLLTDDSRGVIYYRNMFIVEATGEISNKLLKTKFNLIWEHLKQYSQNF